jgi:hypothetical protein
LSSVRDQRHSLNLSGWFIFSRSFGVTQLIAIIWALKGAIPLEGFAISLEGFAVPLGGCAIALKFPVALGVN